ncbi:crossover junction endonuclease MUS81 [Nematostella vectensis]|uniref:crossover junction endonuclease MUS81 n=1 Tax=Nematostella vectensis TaxID=45351 RepID=UPI00138FC314|nr:crossover junction endonuclease MUS81 [Nematostella vectensis]
MGRKAKKPFENPNPLFLKWLEEWRDEARAKDSKLKHAYAKAASSMCKYPMPLQCGRDAMILEGIGESIAQKLDAALNKHYAELGIDPLAHVTHPDNTSMARSSSLLSVPSPSDYGSRPTAKRAKQKKQPPKSGKKEYVPGYRTGAYALILTLFTDSQHPKSCGYMNRAELQQQAQGLCDTSFTIPEPGTRYTAWSSMSTLIKKGYVIKSSSPAKYSITDEGCALALRLQTVGPPDVGSPGRPSVAPFCVTAPHGSPIARASSMAVRHTPAVNHASIVDDDDDDDSMDITHTQTSTATGMIDDPGPCLIEHVQLFAPSLPSQSISGTGVNFTPTFTLKPGTFDIVLCVDFIETTGGASKRKDTLVPELQSNGVEHSVRKLQVGDFLWVARERTRPLPGQLSLPVRRELVLDYICERKRMDDLNQSIIDGRFKEQKFRLRNCGLRHPIYLVEDFGSAQNLSLPESTLQQAIVNTQVIDGFFVKRTQDLRESVAYLTIMTRFLQSFYKDKTLLAFPREHLDFMASYDLSSSQVPLMTFEEFSERTVKNKAMTVSEMFGKQLMQVSGMSADKAVAILNKYPTPKSLMDAYDMQPTDSHRESMLACLKYGKTQRNLGPSISRLVRMLYCTRGSLY